jgi:hypothetical protein
MEEYTPQIQADGKHALFLVELAQCASCKKPMIVKPTGRGPFPSWYKTDFYSQCKTAGIKINSGVKTGDGWSHICTECAA